MLLGNSSFEGRSGETPASEPAFSGEAGAALGHHTGAPRGSVDVPDTGHGEATLESFLQCLRAWNHVPIAKHK